MDGNIWNNNYQLLNPMGYLLNKTEENLAKENYPNMVFKAMCSISDTRDTVLISTKFEKDLIYERNYVLCLVYQLGIFSKTNEFISGAFVNGEITKKINFKDPHISKAFNKLVSLRPKPKGKREKKNNKIRKAEYSNVMPDFLIHTSHNTSFTRDEQLLIVEVKTTCDLKKEEFFWDLFKL